MPASDDTSAVTQATHFKGSARITARLELGEFCPFRANRSLDGEEAPEIGKALVDVSEPGPDG